VLKPVINPNGVIVKFSPFSMLWLPDQALTEGTPAEVRQLLADNVKETAPNNAEILNCARSILLGPTSVRLLCFAYWILRRIFKFFFDDGFDDFKAQAIFLCSEICGLMTIFFSASLVVGHSLLPELKYGKWWLAIGLSLILATGNQALFSKSRMARFEPEFEDYSNRTRIVGGFAVVTIFILLVGVSLIAAAAVKHLPRQ
jgi:hypothetical protein